jgi:hypothetical protein
MLAHPLLCKFTYKESKMSERRTEYTLDIAKWRCGGEGGDFGTAMGQCRTRMKNEKGFMCCLGQFAEQAGVTINNPAWLNPLDVAQKHGLYDTNFVQEAPADLGGFQTTPLTDTLIRINDQRDTTIREKVMALTQALAEEGTTLTVHNVHLIPYTAEDTEEEA